MAWPLFNETSCITTDLDSCTLSLDDGVGAAGVVVQSQGFTDAAAALNGKPVTGDDVSHEQLEQQ